MILRRSLFLLACVLTLAGCEEILDSDELPFEERLVIAGVIRTDVNDTIIQITKTLPLNVLFDTNIAFLKDVQGSVRSEGVEYPLEYVGYNSYYRIKGLRSEIGKEYQLEARWQGLRAFATTRIPEVTVIDSIAKMETVNEFGIRECLVTVWARIPIGCSAEIGVFSYQIDSISGDTTFHAQGFEQVKGSRDQTILTPRIYRDSGYSVSQIVVITNTFAPGFYEYSQISSGDPDDPFSNSGAPPQWNIQGDGIGGFFGSARADYRYYY